ncbi:hypothetical protein [Olleya namhaensis]|uniref:Uncharacterized protein n=1 Tax=Olleya namhaensis TaxID=1144750 RepID=A0A1I3IP35_9FLAO|nr:hypothetical protein [Olleya namhaensis]SFI49716.1 hypothetical protein SAMN05443431_10150 [Olleya namhaensis]
MNKDNIYNKENEYKKEIFELLNDDFHETTDDSTIINLLKDLFLADVEDINNEDMIKSLLTDNISTEIVAKNTLKDE